MDGLRIACGAVCALGLVYCTATGDSEDGVIYDDGGEGGAGGGLLEGGFGPGGSAPSGCVDAAELIYVLTDANELYSFQPDVRQFSKIGDLSCNTQLQPNSMAIDRSATAWVNFVDPLDTVGVVYEVSTTDASCDPNPSVTLPAGYARVGMGFSRDGAESDTDTLFVAGIPSGALARVDTTTGNLTPVGTFGGQFAGQSAELTGTGDAQLYGFFTSMPVHVAHIDKATANIMSSTPLSQVEVPLYWAFSFWGGDFYLYTSTGADTTTVNRYRPSDSSVDTAYMENIGFRIVGAGVSVCAPVEPPQ